MLIEYDGTRYSGWQRQENGPSIQGEIEKVLEKIFQENVNVVGAGRTDAGVHARGQVAHVLTYTDMSPYEIKGGLNGLLPEDIVILELEEVDLNFHARYSAKERQYSYLITQKPTAILRNFCWYVKYDLDLNILTKLAEVIKGKNNFQSFCKTGSATENYHCTVTESEWFYEFPFLRYKISADRFLYGMVRALVGTMVDVSRGYLSYEEFIDIFEKNNRCEAGRSAPARGLVLESVKY